MNEVRLMRTPEKTWFTPAHYCVPVLLRTAVETKKGKVENQSGRVDKMT